jgi:hypothetical protein
MRNIQWSGRNHCAYIGHVSFTRTLGGAANNLFVMTTRACHVA